MPPTWCPEQGLILQHRPAAGLFPSGRSLPARLGFSLALSLLPCLSACSGEAVILVTLQLGSPDPLQGVSVVRLEASGPAPMEPVRSEATRTSGEVLLPPIPFGPERRITVLGLDAGRFVLSLGASVPFEVSAAGPDRITVPFARCELDLRRDEDGDGFGVAVGVSRRGCAQPGWAAGGGDCDDKDRDAYPGQPQFFARPRTGAGGFDFNCDGKEETSNAVICVGAKPCQGEGWSSAVARCGDSGQYGTCDKVGADCVPTKVASKAQSCR